MDRGSLSWESGRGLLEVYQGWTDAASAGDERIHVKNTEQLHEHNCHPDVTETSGHRMIHQKYKHRNSESVKQSTRYVTHGHMDVLCKTMDWDNTHVSGKTHGMM